MKILPTKRKYYFKGICYYIYDGDSLVEKVILKIKNLIKKIK